MVGATGIEPVTPAMSRRCSTAELRAPSERGPSRMIAATAQPGVTPPSSCGSDRGRHGGFYVAWTSPCKRPNRPTTRPMSSPCPRGRPPPSSSPPPIAAETTPPPSSRPQGSTRSASAAAKTASSTSFSPAPQPSAPPCSAPPSPAPIATPTAKPGNSTPTCSPTVCRPGSTPPAPASAQGSEPWPAWSPAASPSTATS